MASRTAWTAGNGVGLTYGTLINSADMASLASGNSVLSTVADIANGTNLDMFIDISYLLTIASNTIAAGANFAFWLYYLNQDGSHYGDNQLPTPGTAANITPTVSTGPFTHSVPPVASTTTMYGTLTGITVAPGSFRVAIQNNCGIILTSGTQTVKYRSYNIQLNN